MYFNLSEWFEYFWELNLRKMYCLIHIKQENLPSEDNLKDNLKGKEVAFISVICLLPVSTNLSVFSVSLELTWQTWGLRSKPLNAIVAFIKLGCVCLLFDSSVLLPGFIILGTLRLSNVLHRALFSALLLLRMTSY